MFGARRILNGVKVGANAAFVGLGAPSLRPSVTARRMEAMFPPKKLASYASHGDPLDWSAIPRAMEARKAEMAAARRRGIRRTGALGGVAAFDGQNRLTQRNDAKYRERMRSASMKNGQAIL